jgi:uncharacterized damage-inducible protein DinB
MPNRLRKRGRQVAKQNTRDVLEKLHSRKWNNLIKPAQSSPNPVSAAFVEHARALLLSEYLPKIERCLERLTDEQLWWRANEESNSIGNLILHLSGNVRQWIISGLAGRPDHRERDKEFAQREQITREALLQLLRETLSEVDSVLAEFDHSRLLDDQRIQSLEVTALEAIFHVTEHFSMHTGQILYITKLLTSTDLQFYQFDTGRPTKHWLSAEGS